MSDQPQIRRGSIEGLWPWPGVALVVLLAAWFLYMGVMAEVPDIKTAFLGLAGVTAVVALLGLRAANLGGARSPDRSRNRRGEGRRGNGRKRSAIADPIDEQSAGSGTGWVFAAEAEAAASAEREEAGVGVGESPAPQAEEVEPDPPAPQESPRRPARKREQQVRLAAVPPPQPHGGRPTSLEEMAEAIEELTVLVNREKAERGAAFARIASRGEAEGDGPEGRELNVALEERLNNYLTIQAFNNAMNQRVFPQISQMIEKALDDKIGPDALKEQVGHAAAIAEDDPQASATFALQLAEARQALEAHVEEAQKDRKALRDEIRGARKLAERAARTVDVTVDDGKPGDRDLLGLVQELRAARRVDRERLAALEAAVAGKSAAEGDAPQGAAAPGAQNPAVSLDAVTRLDERIDKVAQETRARLEEVASTLAGTTEAATGPGEDGQGERGNPRRLVQVVRRELEEVRETADRRIAELEAALNEVRAAGQRMAQQVELAQTAQLSMADRLQALAGPAQSDEADPSTGQSVREDVDALRNALTTIIEQNRAIRVQQDMLTARFDPAGPSEDGDPPQS